MNNIAVTISNANKSINPIESIHAIYDAGFRNVFVEWYNKDWEISQQEQLDECRKLGLNVIFAHLGYQGINNLWLENDEGEALVTRFKNDIRICKENGFDLVVMHVTSKSEAPGPNAIGIQRLTEIVGYAKELGVKVAFEKTKIKGYLEYIVDHIPDAGICLNVGHMHAHFKDELPFEKFVDKIFAVHLHDNHGDKDAHLLPFEGTLDWKWLIEKLHACHYDGPITMELVYQNDYVAMDVVDFYRKGFEIGLQLQSMFGE